MIDINAVSWISLKVESIKKSKIFSLTYNTTMCHEKERHLTLTWINRSPWIYLLSWNDHSCS